MKTETETIAQLVQIASVVLPAQFTPRCCVNVTRVLIDVLKNFDISARPVSVQLVVTNALWREQMIEAWRTKTKIDRKLTDRWAAEGGWSAAVDTRGAYDEKSWPGHLVLVTENDLIDGAMGQLSRPEKDMELPNVLVCQHTSEFLYKEKVLQVTGPNGVWVRYWVREDTSFWKLPGFQDNELNREVTTYITRLMGGTVKTTGTVRTPRFAASKNPRTTRPRKRRLRSGRS